MNNFMIEDLILSSIILRNILTFFGVEKYTVNPHSVLVTFLKIDAFRKNSIAWGEEHVGNGGNSRHLQICQATF